ncbi:molybdate ABC transporter substrate-binding protein [Enhydrobacter sp.]|jgi:molybdate transport system substrate-binding protein|uniref:molybdate ABC transporter substrate-binding protein n=1 Tax=Enhydrobacter sp. TaxID=1894999 RepID=UPI00262EA898|nr:molybdate ABC transporter substrate-binding protein [Enhydrobacter sp.]WIM11384.1 MAG: Molybdenum ABC transporter, substrate-binding protein ModA [Enhydrobacter sp.]
MGLSIGRRSLLGLVLASTAAPLAAAKAADASLVIFAAASLKNALDEIAGGWAKEAGKARPKISYAASSALARQLEQGAPADIFISADIDWMDYVAKKGLIRDETRVNLLGNKIVLIAPRDSKTTIEVKPGFDLAKALGDGKLAMANVDAVPAGKYGKAALQKLGAWDGVKGRIAQADNVRAALVLVARGEAPLGIVYSTDAAVEPDVKIIGTFPDDSHKPIIYPAAVTKESKSADARPFLDFLKGSKARIAFEKQGFTVLVKSNSST